MHIALARQLTLLSTIFHPSRPAVRMAAAKEEVDYLVVGAGASGMAFVDTLFAHAPQPVSVLLVDEREQPGGHWNDAYDYATLHQPARNYGVETVRLEEAAKSNSELRATKAEILDHYSALLAGWQSKGHRVQFVGSASFDFEASAYTTKDGVRSAVPARKVVDARYTTNDLPLHVPPRFKFDSERLDLIPPNELPARGADAAQQRYCVLGAGKTGQDTMLYLRETLGVAAEHILWVMPTAPWITRRDPPPGLKQNTCMEFLSVALEAHAAAGSPAGAAESAEFLQRGFEALEAAGNIYKLDATRKPTKFMDATLNAREVDVLLGCAPSVVSGKGRVASIGDDGALNFADGSTVALPWAAEGEGKGVEATTFVHCTTGAFNFGRSSAEAARPVFAPDAIRVQEIFQFPGFCFNGAVIAWLECQRGLSLDEKNRLCELPPPPAGPTTPPPLGPEAGDLGPMTADHPLVRSHRNLRRWYATEGMGEWLHSLRLFSLTMNGYSLEEGRALIERNHNGLVATGVLAE